MISFKKPKNVKSETVRIPAASRKLRLLVVRPEGARGEWTGVLWIHGGGYVTGMPEMAYMSRAIDLVTRGGAVHVRQGPPNGEYRVPDAALSDAGLSRYRVL